MTCCGSKKECCETVSAMSVEQVETLKVSAQNFGFDLSWVGEVIERWGGEVLNLAVEAARSGFGISFIMEVLQKFGPSVLEFLVDLLNRHRMNVQMAAASGESVVVDGTALEGIESSILNLLVEKFLPLLIEKYGDQLLQLVMDALLKVLSNK